MLLYLVQFVKNIYFEEIFFLTKKPKTLDNLFNSAIFIKGFQLRKRLLNVLFCV